MPRKKNMINMSDVQIAIFKRKTTQGRINKLIDSTSESNMIVDSILHYINEVVIHKHPDDFRRNAIKYTIKPRIKKLLKGLI